MRAAASLRNKTIQGLIEFFQPAKNQPTWIRIRIIGLQPFQTHALHVHEYGDFSKGCESAGGHFNPFGNQHGSALLHGSDRHAGDLINNVTTNEKGSVDVQFKDPLIRIFGCTSKSILGRSVMLHLNADDLGIKREFQSESGKQSGTTGNAGQRIACGVIYLTKS